MIRSIITVGVITTLGYSQSMNNYYKILRNNNLVLKNSKALISINKEKTKLTKSWDNPVFSIGVNDLLLNKNFLNRDIEAMQTQYISLSQKIPTNNKLGIKASISRSEELISKLIYKDIYLKFKSSLAFEIYKYAILKRKYALINSYIANVSSITKLHTQHLATSKMSEVNIQKSKLLFSQLKIKKGLLKQKLTTTKYKIEKILYKRVKNISIKLSMKHKTKVNLNKHPLIKAYKEKILQAKKVVAFERANKIPDIKLSIAYNNRIKRGDYLSLKLSMPLPIRGREDKKINIASIKLKQVKNELYTLKNNYKQEIKIYKALMAQAKKNYLTIKNRLIPTQKKIGKLYENELYTKNRSSFSMLENLNSIISLEIQALDEMQNYFNAYSKLIYFKGK